MNRLPDSLLRRMADLVSPEDRDEMAIPSYLHGNPVMRWMAWRRLQSIVSRFNEIDVERSSLGAVADFGCGTGVLFEEAARRARHVYGIDLVLEPARLCLEHLGLDNVDLLTPDQMAQRIRKGEIDVILAAEVLEHVEPLGPTLEEFRRVLAPHGRLLVSLPTENAVYRLGRRLAGFEGHYHHSNARSIDRAITSMGFRRLHRSVVPLPGPFAVYWILDYAKD